jgi:hypothetical protein
MLKRQRRAEPQIPASVLSLLAVGWEGLVTLDSDPDAFAPWEFSDAQLVEAYRRHAPLVDAEARRLGRERPWIVDQADFWRRVMDRTDDDTSAA